MFRFGAGEAVAVSCQEQATAWTFEPDFIFKYKICTRIKSENSHLLHSRSQ